MPSALDVSQALSCKMVRCVGAKKALWLEALENSRDYEMCRTRLGGNLGWFFTQMVRVLTAAF
jgi:hypothetical protein